jgi:uncharacterized protein YndB with AHSA1/START domain
MELKFDVYAKIERPVADVFRAVTDPKELCAYFTTGGASGPLTEGAKVLWKFGDSPGEYPVHVTRLVPNERIELTWDAEADTYLTQVIMTFESLDAGHTLVRIVEGVWKSDSKGLKSSYGNCSGWTQMLCCLKAHLEYKINLRRGFF